MSVPNAAPHVFRIDLPCGSTIYGYPHPVKAGRGGRFEAYRQSLADADLERRIFEAQQRINTANPGDCISIDLDLLPYVNQTEK